MMELNVSSNLEQVLQAIQAIEQRGNNLEPMFDDVAKFLAQITEQAFDDQASPLDDQAWDTLEDSTLKAKKGLGKPLYLEGNMQGSLQSFSDNSRAIIGLNAESNGYPYPAVHQFGTEDGRVPARAFMPFYANGEVTDEVKGGVISLIAEHFLGQSL